MEPSKADEATRRYHEANARCNRRTSFWIMLLGLLGSLVTGGIVVFALTRGVIHLQSILFLLISLAAFVGGLIGCVKGDRTVNRNWDPFGE